MNEHVTSNFKCPVCGSTTRVSETRAAAYGSRRRRVCKSASCGHRFTTAEIIADWPEGTPTSEVMLVSKADIKALVDVVEILRGRGRQL